MVENTMSIKPKHIHIFGASGSGTTTLGKSVADHLSIPHFDTDSYYWKESAVEYSEKIPVTERVKNITDDLDQHPNCVLSGSLCCWGDPIVKHFTHVIFLSTTWAIRKARLIKREEQRYGIAIQKKQTPQGQVSRDFIDWASRYDTAGLEQRSLQTHLEWMKALPKEVSVLHLDANIPIVDLTNAVLSKLD